jgi:transposase-like protein
LVAAIGEEVRMSRRRHTPEQIITALREAEVGLANGKTVGMVSRELRISEQTYYRWRQEFGGMKVDQARRFKELEKENARLKRAVANLTVDKLILEEATKGNF